MHGDRYTRGRRTSTSLPRHGGDGGGGGGDRQFYQPHDFLFFLFLLLLPVHHGLDDLPFLGRQMRQVRHLGGHSLQYPTPAHGTE